MKVPDFANINGSRVAVSPRGTLHTINQLLKAWKHWSNGFSSQTGDRMCFEWIEPQKRMAVKFYAGDGSKHFHATDRKSFFLFNMSSPESAVLLERLNESPFPWEKMFDDDFEELMQFPDGTSTIFSGKMVPDVMKVLDRDDVKLAFQPVELRPR